MKVAVYVGPRTPFRIEERPVPEPAPDELLLRIARCGICATDVHTFTGDAGLPIGGVYGHEFAGEIVGCGDAVDDFALGEHVTAQCVTACGQCEACREGHLVFCPDWRHHAPGGFAQFMTLPAREAYRLPPSLTLTDGALVEPLAVGLAAFRDCQLPLGGNVLIIGAGIIGMTVLKWARFFGAENVVISDLDEARLARAKLAGATGIIDAGENPDPVQAFRDATGVAPDVIVECVGRPMLQQLIDAAAIGTHIVAVGAAMQPEPITSVTAAQKKIRITFSFGYTLEDFQFIIRILESGRIQTDELITRSVSLDEVPEAFAGLLEPNGHCKIMIEP